MVDCRVSSDPVETITLDDSSNEAPTTENPEPAVAPNEQTDANRSSDSCISSLNYCSDSEEPQDESAEPIQQTDEVPNTSQTPTLPTESSFTFGPYVPIFRKGNEIFIDPRGIIKHYYESKPSAMSKRLACEVLPDDAIVDSPSFVVPLLLKKKTTLPPIKTSQSSEHKVSKEDGNAAQEEFNSENTTTSQKLNSSSDVEVIKVVKQTNPSNCGSDKILNRKSVDEYIKSTCVASLTSARGGSQTQTVSTLQDYYKSSAGELLLGIGLSRVRETYLHDNFKRVTKKIKRSGDDCLAENYKLYDSIKEELSQTMAVNKVFKSAELYNCPRCPFKSEFAVVMDGHLEVPHLNKKDYLCNWCEYKTNDSANIIYHNLVKHNRRCRIEPPQTLHLCPWCFFEGKDKRKLKSHLSTCERIFNIRYSDCFMGPEDYLDDGYPGITSKPIDQEDIKAYESTLKTLRLAAYNPHQIKISGLPQTSNQPIVLVQRQNGSQLASGSNYSKNPMQTTNQPVPQIMTKEQLANAANQSTHSTQLMQLLSGQNPNTNNLRGGTLQYPRSQSPFVNGNSVLRTTSEFVMAPNQQPRVDNGDKLPTAARTVNTTSDLTKEQEDVQILNYEAKTCTSSSLKGSTFVICEICDGYIKDLGQLKSHMQWIHKVKIHQKMLVSRPPLNCQKCQWRFFTDQGLERHLLGAHGLVTSNMQELVEKCSDSGRCTVCGRAFASKLVAHMKEAHKSTLKPAHLTYRCTVCSATFNLYRLFENHVYSVHNDSVRRIPSS